MSHTSFDQLNLDGTVEVTHPDWTVMTYPLERLTRLYDGIEQLEEDAFDAGSDDGHSHGEEEETWTMDKDGIWRPETQENDEWEDISMQGVEAEEDIEIDEAEGLMEVDSIISPSEAAQIESMGSDASADTNLRPLEGSEGAAVVEVVGVQQDDLGEGIQWKRFEILSSAPPDHAFFSSPPALPSKSFLGRLSKEYRVLTSSLPGPCTHKAFFFVCRPYSFSNLDSILVRAYEDRTDLLRCLIIGPENTPYQDAPFVIDWMLDSNFPHSPPVAHFLSWTNGNGRGISPKYYPVFETFLNSSLLRQ